MAAAAGAEGISIHHLTLIDPVRISLTSFPPGQPESLTVPGNVERADNYFQSSGGPFKGGPAANPSSTVVNHDVSGPGVDHNTIVEKVLQTKLIYNGSLIPQRVTVQKTSN